MIARSIEVPTTLRNRVPIQSQARRVPLFGPWGQVLTCFIVTLTRAPRGPKALSDTNFHGSLKT